MEDLDPQVIAALARAAKGNPELRSAASAIFAALGRHDEEVLRLRAENAALLDIARTMALLGTRPDSKAHDFVCLFCGARSPDGQDAIPHSLGCHVVKASDLLNATR